MYNVQCTYTMYIYSTCTRSAAPVEEKTKVGCLLINIYMLFNNVNYKIKAEGETEVHLAATQPTL